MTLQQIKEVVRENIKAGRCPYYGLASCEIGTYNRAIMWGENHEAYPGDEEWSRIVD